MWSPCRSFEAVSTSRPLPSIARLPEPLIVPAIVMGLKFCVSKVATALPLMLTPRLAGIEVAEPNCKVPPLPVKASPLLGCPKEASELMFKTPPAIVVPPEYALLETNRQYARAGFVRATRPVGPSVSVPLNTVAAVWLAVRTEVPVPLLVIVPEGALKLVTKGLYPPRSSTPPLAASPPHQGRGVAQLQRSGADRRAAAVAIGGADRHAAVAVDGQGGRSIVRIDDPIGTADRIVEITVGERHTQRIDVAAGDAHVGRADGVVVEQHLVIGQELGARLRRQQFPVVRRADRGRAPQAACLARPVGRISCDG